MASDPADRFRAFGRKAAPAETTAVAPGPIGLQVEALDDQLDLAGWLAARDEWLGAQLLAHGAVLFRGFRLDAPEDFLRAVTVHGDEPLEYEDAHTPRTDLSGGLYTSTEYPPDHEVPMHSENSKNLAWPRRIWFHCRVPAATGGATPLADNRRVLAELPDDVVRAFAERGVRYVRRLGQGLGLRWQDVLGTSDPAAVAGRCARLGVAHEWRDDGSIELSQVGPGTVVHPDTGDELWFNQAHLFHHSTLAPEVRAALAGLAGAQQPPSDVTLGDGSPIADAAIAAINRAFAAVRRETPWSAGDVLVADNMLVAHGRRPYAGERRVLVAMTRRHAGSWSPPAPVAA